jgi:hypothetical protein
VADKRYPIQVVIEAVDKITGPLKNINKQIQQATMPAKELQKSFSGLTRELGFNKIGRAFRNVRESAGGVMLAMRGLAFQLAAVGAAGFGIFKLVSGVAQLGDELNDLSKVTGVSVEALQTLGFAANQSGITTDQFQNALLRFNKTLGDIKGSTGSVFQALQKGDSTFLNQIRGAQNTEEAFRLMLNRIREVPDVNKRAAIAALVFGKSNQQIANLANLSNAELKTLEDRMRRIGVISKATAEQSDLFVDTMNELKLAFQAVRVALFEGALPVLREYFTRVTEWLINNRERAAEWGREFAKRLPDILNSLVDALKTAYQIMKTLGGFIVWMTENSTRLKIALGLLAAVILGNLIVSLVALTKSLWALGAAFLSTPIGWVIVGLIAMGAAVAALIIYWDDLVDIWQSGLRVIEDIIASVSQFTGLDKLLGITHQVEMGQARNTPSSTGKNLETTNTNNASVEVTFSNLPPGARVSSGGEAPDFLDLIYGRSMGASF